MTDQTAIFTPEVLTALIASIPAIIASVTALIVSLRAKKESTEAKAAAELAQQRNENNLT